MTFSQQELEKNQQQQQQPKQYVLNSTKKQEIKAYSTDKKVQKQMCNTIFDYLVKHQKYNLLTSPESLSHPSSKTFYSILNVLLSDIDPNLQFPQINDEIITQILKIMGYPFIIGKNTFLAITAPHTWPQLLSILNWLTEILAYEENWKIHGCLFKNNY